MMMRRLRQQLKGKLRRLACGRLGLYPDPPSRVSELAHPLGLLNDLGYHCGGVIHVGVSSGYEFDSYRRARLESMIYVEAIPEVFARLQRRISADSRHRAINALCTDRDGDMVDFHVASNDGQASSIFEFGSHAERHPTVKYVATIKLRTTTLDKIIFETPASIADCSIAWSSTYRGRKPRSWPGANAPWGYAVLCLRRSMKAASTRAMRRSRTLSIY
jgi:FkbM family methyltransferase